MGVSVHSVCTDPWGDSQLRNVFLHLLHFCGTGGQKPLWQPEPGSLGLPGQHFGSRQALFQEVLAAWSEAEG